MIRFFLFLLCLGITLPAHAGTLKYYEDPVYQQLNGQDIHPMSDLLSLADSGDVRAQFILGDLYAKGKGGLSKNPKTGAMWFERAAMQGYVPSFIRLAALAKHRKDFVSAHQWYSLVLQTGNGQEREFSKMARNELIAAEKMTPAQIATAKTQAQEWKNKATKAAKEQAEMKKIEARRAAIVEKVTPPSEKEKEDE